MSITIAALITEINTDPTGLGLVALKNAGNATQLVVVLNQVRAGIVVTREPVTASFLFSRIDPTEFEALTAIQLQRLQVILTVPELNLNDLSTRTILANIFVSRPTTLGNLNQARNRLGSRIEQLAGTGTLVDIEQISKAIGA